VTVAMTEQQQPGRQLPGTNTELDGHPPRCGCLECRAWREFQPMYENYQHARRLRLWEEFLLAFYKNDPAARARFYAEVPMNRHQRRRLEARARRLRQRRGAR
jgi:hypothetical protein